MDGIVVESAYCSSNTETIPMRYFLLSLLLACCFLLSAQQEMIEHFSVDIITRQDASLDVTETITVVVQGDQIKRGLTRALHREPLGDDTELGNFKYEVLSVKRDGVEEPFFTKRQGGLPTIYTGDKDVFLDPGTYVYEIRYRAFEQVYGLDRIDEIRWPLEGKKGSLPIKDADITIRFDRDIQIINSACYTGVTGSTAEDCEFSQDGNIVTFVTTRPLQPGEGMTVAASISAGYFQRPEPPTPVEKNTTLAILVFGFAIALGYAYTSWQKYGVDPEGPPIKNEYFPPEGYSPASISYLLNGWVNAQQVTASLTVLATQGYVKIEEEERKKLLFTYDVFIIRPTDKVPTEGEVSAEALVLYRELLSEGEVELGGEYQKHVAKANAEHGKSLKEQHDAFLKQGLNLGKMVPLVFILLATMVGGFLSMFLTEYGGMALAIVGVSAVVLLAVYAWLIGKPSLEKVTLRNKIKGLRQYLKLSEKKRKALPNAPEMSREYFELILPYAIALGIENDWAEALTEYLSTPQGGAYGNNNLGALPLFLLPGFGSRIGHFYGKSAVNPASSGGGGGGGFSGGGGSVGGGGGTGGW